MADVINIKIDKIDHKYSILCDGVLNPIENTNKEIANDELRQDEVEVERELIECQNIRSSSPTYARVVGVTNAKCWNEIMNSPNEINIETAKTESKSSHKKLGLDVSI